MSANFKQLYSEVINGYTYNEFFIRHFTLRDDAEIERLRTQFYNAALANGLQTEKDTLDFIIKEKIWTKEDAYNALLEDIKFLKQTKSLLIQIQDLEANEEAVKKEELKLRDLAAERYSFLGATAESNSNSRLLEYYVYISFYKDENLRERLLSKDDLLNISTEDLDKYLALYNTVCLQFGGHILKSIGFTPMVLNHMFLAENCYEFYGKPITSLSHFQIDLYSWGNYYRNIVKNHGNPPENITDNPEYIIEWANSLKQMEKYNKQNIEEKSDFRDKLNNLGDGNSLSFSDVVNSNKGLGNKKIIM